MALLSWITACAGRLRAISAACARPARGRQAPRYHGSAELAERPAWMQVVESRLEQAAEESRKEGRVGEGMAGFAGWCVGLSCLLSFPLCGNDLSQPLDSGLRRNDGGG